MLVAMRLWQSALRFYRSVEGGGRAWVPWMAAALCGCVRASGAAVERSAEAPDAPESSDMEMVTPHEAEMEDLVETELSLDFPGDDTDGKTVLSAWLAAARKQGSRRVGEIKVYIVRERDDDTVECRTTFYSAKSVVPRTVPGGSHPVSVTRPVLRSVTRYEQRCHMVSKPVTHMETTYSYQYDAFSKSTRSVPQMHSVTTYQMENQCRSEPVTSMETHWEYATEWRFEPPRTEWLEQNKLRETEPACWVVEGKPPVSRVVGTFYVPYTPEGMTTSDDKSPPPREHPECRQAFGHIDELTKAWGELHPERTMRRPPSRLAFLALCHALSPEQQQCLVMPRARTDRAGCARLLDALAPRVKIRVDEMFLEPEAEKTEEE